MDNNQANALFLTFESRRIPQMAQAVIDSGWLTGSCTFGELQEIFRQRGLGANNVMSFLRYAESLEDPRP